MNTRLLEDSDLSAFNEEAWIEVLKSVDQTYEDLINHMLSGEQLPRIC